MFFHERARMAARFIVEHIGNIALLPELDIFGFMGGCVGITHLCEQRAQRVRFRMGEFDEFKAICPCWVLSGNCGFRGVVRKRSH